MENQVRRDQYFETLSRSSKWILSQSEVVMIWWNLAKYAEAWTRKEGRNVGLEIPIITLRVTL